VWYFCFSFFWSLKAINVTTVCILKRSEIIKKKKKNQTQIQIKKKQENPPQKTPQKKQNNKLTRKAKITTTNKRTTSRFNICQSPDTKLCNEIQEYILYSPASEIKRDYFFFYPVLGDCLHYH
jgi:DNA/RNA endonuclease G (NUC1)